MDMTPASGISLMYTCFKTAFLACILTRYGESSIKFIKTSNQY